MEIKGQADTEVLFYLALTLGLEDDPPAAVAQAIGLVEAVADRHEVPYPFQGTIATTDGESIWAFRYSSEKNELYPEVVDACEEEGGVPSRLIKTDRREAGKEGTPWRMFAGSRLGRTTRVGARSMVSLARARAA